MYALKRGINSHAREFGLCICGGRGKYSRQTPDEINFLCNATGLNGTELVRASKLCAKVDSTAVQDGFQLYQHNFILSDEGDWAVVQQGMNVEARTARRYHWCSTNLRSFIEEPHTGVTGENRGLILNLTDSHADTTRSSILSMAKESPDRSSTRRILHEIASCRIIIVRAEDVDRIKRLGAVLHRIRVATKDVEFASSTKGARPAQLHLLLLVSEVCMVLNHVLSYPGGFSFAHGGQDGHPYPVPVENFTTNQSECCTKA